MIRSATPRRLPPCPRHHRMRSQRACVLGSQKLMQQVFFLRRANGVHPPSATPIPPGTRARRPVLRWLGCTCPIGGRRKRFGRMGRGRGEGETPRLDDEMPLYLCLTGAKNRLRDNGTENDPRDWQLIGVKVKPGPSGDCHPSKEAPAVWDCDMPTYLDREHVAPGRRVPARW